MAVLASGAMDAKTALADLMEISAQVNEAVLLDASGSVVASTPADERRAEELARAASDLLETAASVRSDAGSVTQVEASTPAGSVFVVRDAERAIVATTGAQPTVGLVVYDLKTCLRHVATEEPGDAKPKAKRTRRKKKEEETA